VVVVGRGFQDQEGTVPIDYLQEEGAEVFTIKTTIIRLLLNNTFGPLTRIANIIRVCFSPL